MNTSEIIEILDYINIHPNKRLGQNFLCNTGIIERIIDTAKIDPEDSILEIGPGLGILTEALTEKAGNVTAVEIDSGLCKFLQERFRERTNLDIVHGDFLKLSPYSRFTKTISNLPYYCSSEILFKLALDYEMPGIYVMLQKEMAERIEAKPGTKEYGAISVMLGLYYKPRIMFKIDKRSFYPRPDVDSCFIRLLRNKDRLPCDDEAGLLQGLVKSAFWGRRKTILKSLTDSPHLHFDKDFLSSALKNAGIDEKRRGETLTIEEYRELAQKIRRNY